MPSKLDLIPGYSGAGRVERGVCGFAEKVGTWQNPNPAWVPLAPQSNGKFQVPTCRNVDLRPYAGFVKAYGHNGYFKSLKAIVHFYSTRDTLNGGVNLPAGRLGAGMEVRGFSGRSQSMALPITGSVELLELPSPFVADDHINEVLPRHRGAGRPTQWSGAQIYRTLLLMLLIPARSSNLLCSLLLDQRAWRRFAHLPNRNRLPNAASFMSFATD